MKTYYDILNVDNNASQNEIKQSFRKLSLQFHPDKDKNYQSQNKYEEIMTAYTTLENVAMRKLYDISISSTSANGNKMDSQLSDYNNDITDNNDNINNSLAMTLRQNHPKVHDQHRSVATISLHANISITLEQAYMGGQYPIEIERFIYEDGYKVKEREKIYIHIDPGTDNNEIIYVKNKGHGSVDGQLSDLKVYIHVQQHDLFKRNGLDLVFNKSINFEESLCGFSFNIPFLTGNNICIRNHEGDIILNGAKIVLKNKGMQRNNVYGKMIIQFSVIQPKRLKKEHVQEMKKILLKNAQ